MEKSCSIITPNAGYPGRCVNTN